MRYEFKYYTDIEKNGYFSKEKCELCNSEKDCLEGTFFSFEGDYENLETICLDCFLNKQIDRYIPEYLEYQLRENIKNYYPNKSEEEIDKEVDFKINELKRTPAISWIQNNDWQICCGDFCTFVGEWTREDFNKMAPDGNGKKYMFNILNDLDKKRIENDIDYTWDDINYNTAVFVFKCLHCSKYIAVVQWY